MSAEEFKTWASSSDPAVTIEEAMSKGEEMGLRSFESRSVLKDLQDEGNLNGGFVDIGGEPERIGFAGEPEAVSEAINQYEQENLDEVSDQLSRVEDILDSMNQLHQEYSEASTNVPYGEFTNEEVQEHGDQLLDLLMDYGEQALGMDERENPEVRYRDKGEFKAGHGIIGYKKGDEPSDIDDLEDFFDLDIEVAMPTPLELFHEASHMATEELAKRQFKSEGNDGEMGNYVSGYLDENREEVANELMMYTWEQADTEERYQITGGVDEQVFEQALESYLEETKMRKGEYREQHPIEGTEQSFGEIYAA